MAKVKVLYLDQTAGGVEESFLNNLIAKGKIAAFCGSSGWIDVKAEEVSGFAPEQNERRKGERR